MAAQIAGPAAEAGRAAGIDFAVGLRRAAEGPLPVRPLLQGIPQVGEEGGLGLLARHRVDVAHPVEERARQPGGADERLAAHQPMDHPGKRLAVDGRPGIAQLGAHLFADDEEIAAVIAQLLTQRLLLLQADRVEVPHSQIPGPGPEVAQAGRTVPAKMLHARWNWVRPETISPSVTRNMSFR